MAAERNLAGLLVSVFDRVTGGPGALANAAAAVHQDSLSAQRRLDVAAALAAVEGSPQRTLARPAADSASPRDPAGRRP